MKQAIKSDIPLIAEFCRRCFDDSPETAIRFFSEIWDHSMVFWNEDQTAMATVMPVSWQDLPTAYLYAIATDPDFQGRGYCHNLISEVESYLKNHGYSYAILSPAEPSLFRFYEKMNYRTMFYSNQREFFKTEVSYPVTPVTAEEYFSLRSRFLSDGVVYPVGLLRAQAFVGELVRIGNCDCAAVEKDGDSRTIRELLSDRPADAASSLCHYLNKDCLPIKLPGTAPYGMAKSLDGSPLKPSYLGLGFE